MSDEARLIKTLTRRYEKIGKLARPVDVQCDKLATVVRRTLAQLFRFVLDLFRAGLIPNRA